MNNLAQTSKNNALQKRKRIVIAHNWRETGIDAQSYQLAHALSKTYDVWFLSACRIGAEKIKINEHLTILEWPDKRPTKLKDLLFCRRLFRKIKANIVIAHFSGTRVSMFGAWLAGVKHRVAWYHIISQGLLLDARNKQNEKLSLLKYKSGFLFSNHIVAFCEYGKQDAIGFLNKRAVQIFLIPNGFSLRGFSPNQTGFYKSAPVFLFLGRLQAYKGGDLLIKCFKKISSNFPNAKLLIIGDGEEADEWRTLIKTLQLDHCIEMHGRTSSYDQIFDYLKGAYALLVPSRFDNFPTVIIEAFSCGVPVIGSTAGGIPEMISDGVDGFVCSAEDENEWIEKIELLIGDVCMRNKMALAARKSYEEKFTIEKHVERVTDFLNSLS